MKWIPDLRMGGIGFDSRKDDSRLPDRPEEAEQPLIPDNTLPLPTSSTAFGSTASLPIIILDEAEKIEYPSLPRVFDRRSLPTAPAAKRRRKSSPIATASGSPTSRTDTERPSVRPDHRSLSESHSVAHTLDSRMRRVAGTLAPPSQARAATQTLPGSRDREPGLDNDSDGSTSDDASSISSSAAEDDASTAPSPSSIPGASAAETPAARTDKPHEIDQNVNHFLKRPKQSKSSPKTGYVYILRDHTQRNWVKIGFTTLVPVVRRNQIRYLCERELGLVYDAERPHRHCQRVETLVRRQLAHFNRPHTCPSAKCGKAHREWFEVDEHTALRTVKRWMRFVKQDPWNREDDALTAYWEARLHGMKIADKEERHDDHDVRNKRWDRFVDSTLLDRVWHQVSTVVPRLYNTVVSNGWPLWAGIVALVSWLTPYGGLTFCLAAVVALFSIFRR